MPITKAGASPSTYNVTAGDDAPPVAKEQRPAEAAPPADPKTWLKTGAAKGRPAVNPEPTAADRAVASWSTSWQAALKLPEPKEMERLKADAVDAIKTAQANFTKDNGSVMRAQHAHAVYATTQGALKVPENLPAAIAQGPFTPGAELRALVRISNVSGTVQKDGEKDLRGFALRLTDDKGHVQDLMMNTSEEFMTKNAQGAIVGVRVRGEGVAQLPLAVVKGEMGVGDALHLAKAGKAVLTNDTSVAAHTYWSRTPFQLGEHAVKLRLVPVDPHSNQPLVHSDHELTEDMKMRLQHEPVKYLLQVQGYMNERDTPMNDATKAWKSEFVTVGELTLPQLPKSGPDADAKIKSAENEIDSLAYSITNRWTKDDASLKGLGDINAIREQAYKASAEGRGVKGTTGLRCPMGYG